MPSHDLRSPLLDVLEQRLNKLLDPKDPENPKKWTRQLDDPSKDGWKDVQDLCRILCESQSTGQAPAANNAAGGDSKWVQDTVAAINAMGWNPPGNAYTSVPEWQSPKAGKLQGADFLRGRRGWEIGQVVVDMSAALREAQGDGGGSKPGGGGDPPP